MKVHIGWMMGKFGKRQDISGEPCCGPGPAYVDMSLVQSHILQGGPKKLRQIFLAITLVNMDRF